MGFALPQVDGFFLEQLLNIGVYHIFLPKLAGWCVEALCVAADDDCDWCTVSWQCVEPVNDFVNSGAPARRVANMIKFRSKEKIDPDAAEVSALPEGHSFSVRVPYRMSQHGVAASDAEVENDDCDVAAVHCGACRAPLTRPGALRRTLPLPSGRFDEVIADMICFEGPTAVPTTAREVAYARPGRCLIGEGFVLLHRAD
ncbi:unnamed protein product, partial [Phaeothamnion confervicola]